MVDDAITRFERCRDEVVVSARHADRCTDECYDMVVAWDTARHWVQEHSANGAGVSEPDPHSYPHCE